MSTHPPVTRRMLIEIEVEVTAPSVADIRAAAQKAAEDLVLDHTSLLIQKKTWTRVCKVGVWSVHQLPR